MLDNPFLRGLTPEQYDLLSAVFEHASLPAYTLICKQGEAARFGYLLLEGRVSIRYKPYDGPRIVLTHLHAGDVFGWSSVVGTRLYTSDVLSTTPVVLLRFRGDSLRNLCREYPTAGRTILQKLAQAVSPRWLYAQRQVQGILRTEVFSMSAAPAEEPHRKPVAP